jgi:thiol-disulfide isomerase/thioredoxin
MLKFLTGSRSASRRSKRRTSRSSSPVGEALDVRSKAQIPALQSMLKSGPVALILVYADWCGHCTRYKPMWGELARTPGRMANMASVREDIFSEIPSISKAKIQGYPSVIKVSPNGNIEEFNVPGSKETTNAIDSKKMRDMDAMREEITNINTANVPATVRNTIRYNANNSANNNSANNNNYNNEEDDDENSPNTDIFTPVTSLAGKPGFMRGPMINSNMTSVDDTMNYQGGGGLPLVASVVGAIQAVSPAALLLAAHSLLPKHRRTYKSPKRFSRRASTRRSRRR